MASQALKTSEIRGSGTRTGEEGTARGVDALARAVTRGGGGGITCRTQFVLTLLALHVVVEDVPHLVIDESYSERAIINRCYASVSKLGMGDRVADSEY
jgi:hypothetical protein